MDEELPSYVKITIIVEGDGYETKILIPKAKEPVLGYERIDDFPEDLKAYESPARSSDRIRLNLEVEPLLPETGSLYTVVTTSFGKETDG